MCLETEHLEYVKWARVESDPRDDGWRITERYGSQKGLDNADIRGFLMLRDSDSSGKYKMQGLMQQPCLVF